MFGKKKLDFLPPLEIDPEILRRVTAIPTQELQVHFETIIMGFGVTYDEWVRGSAPAEEVEVTLQAMSALFTELKGRSSE